jgi:hypothetical protein
MLNCGYDLNNDAGSKVFYNVSGTWQQSAYSGSMMIRPAFGFSFDRSANIQQIEKSEFEVYPNPASDFIHLNSEVPIQNVQVFDATGRLIKQSTNKSEIFVGDLEQGTYFIRPVSEISTFKTQKILILR